MLSILAQGCSDALTVRRTYDLRRHARIWTKLKKIWLLNSTLFLGLVLLLEYPVWYLLAALLGSSSLMLQLWKLIYHCALIYPIYLISLLLNGRWYLRIAEEALAQRAEELSRSKLTSLQQKQVQHTAIRRSQPALTLLTNDLYRLIFGLVYLGQVALLGQLPLIGGILLIIATSFMYALYSFEYVWSLLGLTQHQRLVYLSERWLYMIGYGLPLALSGYFAPPIVRDIIFATFFPFFIINSVWAKPIKTANTWLPLKINPFALAQLCVSPLLKRGFSDIYNVTIGTIGLLSKVKRWFRFTQ